MTFVACVLLVRWSMAMQMNRRNAMLTAVAALAMAACARNNDSREDGALDADGGGGGPGGGSGTGGDLSVGVGVGGSSPDWCEDGPKLIYVTSNDNVLRTFDPTTLEFNTIGTIDCPITTSFSVNALAIGQDGVAYVGNFFDGTLWKVSTSDASCEPTNFGLPDGTGPVCDVTPDECHRKFYGLAFASDAARGGSETLYGSIRGEAPNLQGIYGEGLAKMGLPGYQITPIGDFTNGLAGGQCSLTGTADGHLFGLFPYIGSNSPSTVVFAEIDKASGATSAPVDITNDLWAYLWYGGLAFWGGDIWFFTYKDSSGGSQVTRYRYSTDKSFTLEIPNTGFYVTGAAVSVCAPLTPPK